MVRTLLVEAHFLCAIHFCPKSWVVKEGRAECHKSQKPSSSNMTWYQMKVVIEMQKINRENWNFNPQLHHGEASEQLRARWWHIDS